MENKIITYDYISINVKKELELVYIDTYECLGWEFTHSEISMSPQDLLSTKIYFRRDRKINNKQALIKLQRDIDSKFRNIGKLESQKKFKASFNAYGIGLISCVFLALSVFMITDYLSFGTLTVPLQIIFGGVGMLLSIPPYFVYKNTLALTVEKIQPLINNEYDLISEKSEEAGLLINTQK